MAFPTAKTADEAWPEFKRTLSQVKSEAQQIRSASLSGPVGANNIIAYVGQIADQADQMLALAATPGLAEYAQARVGSAFDIAAEYTSVRNALIGTRDWIVTNFPKAPTTNELKEKTFDANGRVVLNVFSTASLSGFRAQLDILIATIN